MFKFDEKKCYRMPAYFGGFDYSPAALYYHDVVGLIYSYTTDGDRLADYIPEGFELLRPELVIAYSQCREIDWMAGSCYNLIEVSAPARFNGKKDKVEGNFSLVVWENKTAPILGGREETGIPKIHADIEDLHIFQQNYFTSASHEGSTFLRLGISGATPLDERTLSEMRTIGAERALFGWRYIPNVGGPGAALSQPILYPQSSAIKNAWTGVGTVEWTELKPEQNPMQWHIIKALAELPMIEMRPATISKCVAILKPSLSRVLE